MRKAQLTVEMIIILVILTLVLTVLFVIFTDRVQMLDQNIKFHEQQIQSQNIATSIANIAFIGESSSKQEYSENKVFFYPKTIIIESEEFTTQTLSYTKLFVANKTGIFKILKQDGVILFE